MKPPACVACKWGQGTTCSEKKSNTAAVQEMKNKLDAMLAQRAQQDAIWLPPTNDEPKNKKK